MLPTRLHTTVPVLQVLFFAHRLPASKIRVSPEPFRIGFRRTRYSPRPSASRRGPHGNQERPRHDPEPTRGFPVPSAPGAFSEASRESAKRIPEGSPGASLLIPLSVLSSLSQRCSDSSGTAAFGSGIRGVPEFPENSSNPLKIEALFRNPFLKLKNRTIYRCFYVSKINAVSLYFLNQGSGTILASFFDQLFISDAKNG